MSIRTEATYKRLFVRVDLNYKNSHAFTGGETISLKRDNDNFNRRETQPVNGIVIHSAIIPSGAEVLMHHNSTHPTYEIFDFKELDGEYIAGTERYFSIPETECFAWRIGDNEWNPAPGFELGLRIFQPYEGAISGILPKQIKNKLYITSGDYKGKVAMTKGNCDYQIVFQNLSGREDSIIRLRNFPNDPTHIRNEIVAIDHETTDRIINGDFLIGLSPTNCKQYGK